MNNELPNIAVLAGMFLLLFATAEAGYYFLKIKAEITRKFVHLGTGLLALLFPLMLQSHWSVLLLCFSFFILLHLSLKFNFLKSINDIERPSVGSLAYPVSVYVCYLAFCFFDRQYFYFYLPVLILAVSDPLAALIGKYLTVNKEKSAKLNKTLAGSIAFFVSAYALTILLIVAFKNDKETLGILLYSALVALVATIAESFSNKGWDNITIPASVLISIITLESVI
jgi:dolichol kinase